MSAQLAKNALDREMALSRVEGDADLLKEIAAKENIALQQTIAVGDGANDLPMLAAAGTRVAR